MAKRDKRTPTRTHGQAPRWVSAFTDIGRPVMSVVVLVLCAPGEQHLAQMAGWNEFLSWGMAGLLAAYAGIAAVVATTRPKGAAGKRSAVLGAVLALLLAMGAQPVSHLFVTGWFSADPRPPVWLVVTVSSIPPLVLGHLLHLAADPGAESVRLTPSDFPDGVTETELRAGWNAPRDLRYSEITEEQGDDSDSEDSEPGMDAARWSPDDPHPLSGYRDTDEAEGMYPGISEPVRPGWLYGQPGQPDTPPRPSRQSDIDARVAAQSTSLMTDSRTWEPDTDDRTDIPSRFRDTRTHGLSGTVAAVRADGHITVTADTDTRTADVYPVPRRTDGQAASLSAFITDLIIAEPDITNTDIRTSVRASYDPDADTDTIGKTARRARLKIAKEATS